MSRSWSHLTRVFGRIGLLSFGGPAAQIALMEDELVAKQRWLQPDEFLRALGFCTLLPGPEAMQLATYAGWRLRGVLGGVLAGLLFVLPGALVVLALSLAYLSFGQVPGVQAAFLGIKAAVLIIVGQAIWRLAGKVLTTPQNGAIAVAAFVALYAFSLPFPLVLVAAAALGFLSARGGSSAPARVAPTPVSASLKTVAFWSAIWWVPLLALYAIAPEGLLWQLGTFFAWLAVVTFGGAYAVLAYMAQVAVEAQGWLTAGQMVDGLGMAETTPGPLILVTLFVGVLAGEGAGGLPMALAAAGVTLWATFVPCFLWVFTGAPYVERLATMPRLQGALQAITAAVLGVIANLGLWFALHVLFADLTALGGMPVPVLSSLSLEALALTCVAGVMMLVARAPLAATLGIMAVLGWGLSLIG